MQRVMDYYETKMKIQKIYIVTCIRTSFPARVILSHDLRNLSLSIEDSASPLGYRSKHSIQNPYVQLKREILIM